MLKISTFCLEKSQTIRSCCCCLFLEGGALTFALLFSKDRHWSSFLLHCKFPLFRWTFVSRSQITIPTLDFCSWFWHGFHSSDLKQKVNIYSLWSSFFLQLSSVSLTHANFFIYNFWVSRNYIPLSLENRARDKRNTEFPGTESGK